MIEEKISNSAEIVEVKEWFCVAPVEDFPEDGGVAVKYKNEQLAVFNLSSKGKWYASQNRCPHKNEMAISRGIIGDSKGEAKVSCPFHKKNFSLESGKCLSGEEYALKTYPVKIENGFVYVGICD